MNAVAAISLGLSHRDRRRRCPTSGVGLPPSVVQSWGGDINVAQTRLRAGSPILFYPAGVPLRLR